MLISPHKLQTLKTVKDPTGFNATLGFNEHCSQSNFAIIF